MKFTKQNFYFIVGLFVVCFMIQYFWNSGVNILDTVYKAVYPFLQGAALAYIINIVMSAYEKVYVLVVKPTSLKMFKRPLSLILAYFTFIALIVWLFSIVLPDLIASISSLLSIDTTSLTNFIKDLNHNEYVSKSLKYFGTDGDLVSTISTYSHQILKQVLSVLTNILTSASSIASAILSVFISLVFSIYVLSSKEKLGYQFNLLLVTYLPKYEKTIHYVLGILHKRFHGFFVSQTLEAIILGTLTAIGMFVLNIPYASTVGILMAFTALIPVIGAFIGMTIGTILIATQSVSLAFIFVIFSIILQQIEGNLIYPKVVGGSIGLPGMWVLLSITVGGSLMGILGIMLSVPLAATCYQLIKDNVENRQTIQ